MQQALTKTCPGQVPAPGHGARVLPLELVPVRARARCPNLCSRAPTKGYVQTGVCARTPCLGTKSEQGLRLRLNNRFLKFNNIPRAQSNCSRGYHFAV